MTIACRCVPTTTVSRAEEEEAVAVAVAVAVAAAAEEEEEEYILKEENIKYSVITNNGVNSESQTRFSIT